MHKSKAMQGAHKTISETEFRLRLASLNHPADNATSHNILKIHQTLHQTHHKALVTQLYDLPKSAGFLGPSLKQKAETPPSHAYDSRAGSRIFSGHGFEFVFGV